MRRRIRAAIVGVAAAIIVVLGVPLGVAAHRSIRNAEVVRVQAAATRALAEIAVPLDRAQVAAISREPDAPRRFVVYDERGHRFFGTESAPDDDLVARALRGQQSSRVGRDIEVVTPITNRLADERVVGAMRVTRSAAVVNRRTALALAVMAVSAAAALGVAWIVANRLARRLTQPLADLADTAEQIGSGGAIRTSPSGIDEIDGLASALTESADRVHDALARERRLSADMSHQLRTPLTSLRLQLEAGDLAAALDDAAQLEDTVDHLLAVARDATPVTVNSRLDRTVRDAARRHQARAEQAGRAVDVEVAGSHPARGSPASVAQILDVLIDNALHHGRGRVLLRVRRIQGGTAVDVCDEGDGIAIADSGRIFDRGHGDGHGIGLALARSLAEAEGGRLTLTSFRPTTFSLILVDADASLGLDRL